MAKFEVTTSLLVHTKIKVVVDADDQNSAIDAAADLLPSNYDPHRAKQWKATIDLKPPKGVRLTEAKAYHFEQTGGGEKAKRIPEAA